MVLNPLFFTIKTNVRFISLLSEPYLAQPKHLRIGAMGIPDDWDPAISYRYNIIYEYYLVNSLEPVIWQPEKFTDLKPHLATSWEFEYWPEEMNVAGFNNTGGTKSIDITLREGVKFQDGSDWNATVLKWNIDRLFIITGNLTGNGNIRNRGTFWANVENDKPFFTLSWNLSQYDAPNLGLTPPIIPPGVNDYAWYDLGPNKSLVEYPGVNILHNDTVRNPAPYGGWDFVAGTAIHYAPYDRYPIVKYVEILENPLSGGTVRIHYNSWNPYGAEGIMNVPMISMYSYNDYSDRGIYGYKNGVLDPRNPTVVDHMIGTGPYIYVEHDDTGTPPGGYMLKNENYWNKTALEADGRFDADYVDIIKFPYGDLGRDALNTAMLTHAIDYGLENPNFHFDYDAMIGNPNINYVENGVHDYISQITMNCINETWWAWPWADSWRRSSYPNAGDKPAGGVPRAMREAMSYAFDYDLYIDFVMDGRAVRTGMIGVDNVYYNSSTPLADYNVIKAREILLTTETDPLLFNTSTPVPHEPNYIYRAGYPMGDHNSISLNPDLYNFSKMCAERGLTASSSDAEWQYIADHDPIFVFNFYWDSAHEDVKSVLQTSLRNIGVALKDKTGATNKVTTIIWDTVRIGHLTTFDGIYSLFSCGAWVMDEHLPSNSPELNLFWAYGDPDKGRWRTQGAIGITSWHYWGNFGFNFDAAADYWLERIKFSDKTGKMDWINKIAEKEQTEIYPKIYISQQKKGLALWNDWEMNFNRGDLFFSNFRYITLPPGDIALDSDAGTPDIDGNFNLNWNVSLGADNYSLYSYNNLIWDINESHNLLYYQNATSPTLVPGLSNGDYYFVVVAHNQYGDTLSNNIHVVVNIYREPAEPVISGYIITLIFCIAICTAVILFKKKKIKLKWR